MIPTPFIYAASPDAVAGRLRRVGDFSAHVYIEYEHRILMLHSLRHGNIMGPGGKLNPDETVLAGLTRELNEEMPVLTEFILSRLHDKSTVGMWRQTKAGVHNTFLIEAKPSDFDVWAKRAELQAVIDREKATLNRPDYLEADGGLVLVPLEPMVRSISDWKHSGQDGDPKIECYIDAMERNYLPLRSIIVPVVEELKTLVRLSQLPMAVRLAFTTVQLGYAHFAGNEMITLDGDPISRLCVSCGINRAIRDDFAASRYTLTCNACGNSNAFFIRELRRLEEQLVDSADLTVLSCKPVEYYETPK
jgi:8-oxo-dGTP pyrophosphatase MutT (NUDIX family)